MGPMTFSAISYEIIGRTCCASGKWSFYAVSKFALKNLVVTLGLKILNFQESEAYARVRVAMPVPVACRQCQCWHRPSGNASTAEGPNVPRPGLHARGERAAAATAVTARAATVSCPNLKNALQLHCRDRSLL